MSEQTGPGRDEPAGGAQVPRDDEPGGASTPRDTEGAGPAGLEDRVRPEDKGAPAANQGKAEPMPPTTGHRDPNAPLTPPPLEAMTVGADDPQRPSLDGGSGQQATPAGAGPANAPQHLSGPGVAPPEARPTVDLTTATGTDLGPENPVSSTPGTSHRAPGLQGDTSPAEQVETDLDDSAAAMVRDTGRASGSGRTHGVQVPSEVPAAGTSEEHGAVQGARIPRSDGAHQA